MDDWNLFKWPKWPPCPYMVKTLKNLLQNLRVDCLETWYVALGGSCTKFVWMVTLGWPWPMFLQGQIWSLGLLKGERVKHCIFPKQWYSVTWNRNFISLCECQRSRSFSDLGLRSLKLNVCQNFWTTSPLKLHGQFQSSFICSILTIWGSETCSNDHGHMTNMAPMPMYSKNLKTSSPEPLGWLAWNLISSVSWLSITKFLQMVTSCWLWPLSWSNLVLGILKREKTMHCIYSKQWYLVIWK